MAQASETEGALPQMDRDTDASVDGERIYVRDERIRRSLAALFAEISNECVQEVDDWRIGTMAADCEICALCFLFCFAKG